MENDDLKRLLDERAIRRIFEDYCRGVDRLDEELIRACYHEDSTDDHGVLQGNGRDFAAFVVKVLGQYAVATQHVLGQSTIDIDRSGDRDGNGDVAWCETYVIAHHRVEHDGQTTLETVGGRYADRVERREGVWKLADRVVITEWEKKETVQPVFPPGSFRGGERSRDDLVYQRTPRI